MDILAHVKIQLFSFCVSTALAATIQQERTDLRVRVIHFSKDLSVDNIVDKTIVETNTTESFSAVGYDEKLTRRERYQHLTEPGKIL